MTAPGWIDPALWPYALLLICGVLPNAVWRVLGVLAARGLDEDSEILVFVRAVSTALLAGVVGKLLTQPSGALALAPGPWRAGALAVAIAAYFLSRRSMLAAVLSGEATLVFAAWRYGGL